MLVVDLQEFHLTFNGFLVRKPDSCGCQAILEDCVLLHYVIELLKHLVGLLHTLCVLNHLLLGLFASTIDALMPGLILLGFAWVSGTDVLVGRLFLYGFG